MRQSQIRTTQRLYPHHSGLPSSAASRIGSDVREGTATAAPRARTAACQAAANGGCKPRDGGVCGDVELGGEATERCAQQTVPADGSFPACSAECRSFEVSATGSRP